MKQYHSIPKTVRNDLFIYAFDKLDGSLIRAEWNPKKSFYKFGTKHQLIDANTKPWGIAIDLIKNKYENGLSVIFKAARHESVICFFELYGKSSFAGSHNFDEPLDVVLFDVAPYKKGLMPPDAFIETFGYLDIPKVIHKGFIDTELFDLVKNAENEGVVCKGIEKNKVVMFKIKSRWWLNKLKDYCKDDTKLFETLS